MTYIWFLDCGNGCVTKVKLSEKMNEELSNWLDNGNDAESWISHYEDTFGVNINSSSWMITENDKIYEVDF